MGLDRSQNGEQPLPRFLASISAAVGRPARWGETGCYLFGVRVRPEGRSPSRACTVSKAEENFALAKSMRPPQFRLSEIEAKKKSAPKSYLTSGRTINALALSAAPDQEKEAQTSQYRGDRADDTAQNDQTRNQRSQYQSRNA